MLKLNDVAHPDWKPHLCLSSRLRVIQTNVIVLLEFWWNCPPSSDSAINEKSRRTMWVLCSWSGPNNKLSARWMGWHYFVVTSFNLVIGQSCTERPFRVNFVLFITRCAFGFHASILQVAKLPWYELLMLCLNSLSIVFLSILSKRG